MALSKVPVDINFIHGLDTKTDPKQVPPGKFLSLVNSVFTKTGQLTKRDGFGALPSLNSTNTVTASTFNQGLVAVGTTLSSYDSETNQWYNKGPIQPLSLSVTTQVRTNTAQLTVDATVAINGLTCTVWYDSDTFSYYKIVNSVTGEIVVSNAALSSTASATVGPKVFVLGNYFVVIFWETIAAVPTLRYLAIPTANPGHPGTATTITTGASITGVFDGFVSPTNGNLYISFLGAGSTVKTFFLTPLLATSSLKTIAGSTPSAISVTVDSSSNTMWVTWFDTGAIYIASYDTVLNAILAKTTLVGSLGTITQITSIAMNGVLTVFYETSNTYSYTPNSPHTSGSRSDFVSSVTYTVAGAVIGTPAVVLRSVGLASKAFYILSTNKLYILITYAGLMEPTYFVIDSSGSAVAKLAFANGAGYMSSANLPGVTVTGNLAQIGYLFKAQTTAVNKDTNVPTGSQVAGIYAQTGINLVSFTFLESGMDTAELGGSLQLAGGFLWQYDGAKPVEQGFHLYPEDLGTATATGSGSITAGTYFYVATYEWTDAAGRIHRSAPSVPVSQVTTTSSSTNTIKVPTLRITYKTTPNTVRIVIYRYSVAQPVYYQITSVTSPIVNSTTTDSITYTDTAADSSILGNTILYTNGGVIENIAAPACTALCPYGTRLFAIDAEDKNLLWYSKQVIEATPVEMNDLFTIYVAPTISAIGSTGDMQCLSAMDDKLIIFKNDAIYYITGTGPDNTGANNDFSNPTFITSTVGSSNQQSIVFMPNGLMFQSDKGIWLLGRDLSTTYIGAPVAQYNSNRVLAANNIPGTNQVRFRLDTGVTLMYDYYYNEWGTFDGILGVSSTIYQSLETVITAPITVSPPNAQPYVISPKVYQQTPGLYLDGSSPVLMSFVTGWLSLAGIQGYERFYQSLLLGEYLSPFKLNVQFAYDFTTAYPQSTIVTPNTPAPKFGLAPGPFGTESPFGGTPTVFKARIFPEKQKCESFQISVTEIYDPTLGVSAGAGLTLSGLQALIGVKKGSRVTPASRNFG